MRLLAVRLLRVAFWRHKCGNLRAEHSTLRTYRSRTNCQSFSRPSFLPEVQRMPCSLRAPPLHPSQCAVRDRPLDCSDPAAPARSDLNTKGQKWKEEEEEEGWGCSPGILAAIVCIAVQASAVFTRLDSRLMRLRAAKDAGSIRLGLQASAKSQKLALQNLKPSASPALKICCPNRAPPWLLANLSTLLLGPTPPGGRKKPLTFWLR